MILQIMIGKFNNTNNSDDEAVRDDSSVENAWQEGVTAEEYVR